MSERYGDNYQNSIQGLPSTANNTDCTSAPRPLLHFTIFGSVNWSLNKTITSTALKGKQNNRKKVIFKYIQHEKAKGKSWETSFLSTGQRKKCWLVCSACKRWLLLPQSAKSASHLLRLLNCVFLVDRAKLVRWSGRLLVKRLHRAGWEVLISLGKIKND